MVEAQTGQVVDSLAQCPRHARVRGLEDRRLIDPAPFGDLMIGVGLEELMAGTGHPALRAVDHRHPPQTAVPGVGRGELDPEQNASVGELGRRVVIGYLEDQ
jgi:hypothetical protein